VKIAEDPQQQDDRDRDSDQPEQYAFAHEALSFSIHNESGLQSRRPMRPMTHPMQSASKAVV
jgi:hypothetical protein